MLVCTDANVRESLWLCSLCSPKGKYIHRAAPTIIFNSNAANLLAEFINSVPVQHLGLRFTIFVYNLQLTGVEEHSMPEVRKLFDVHQAHQSQDNNFHQHLRSIRLTMSASLDALINNVSMKYKPVAKVACFNKSEQLIHCVLAIFVRWINVQ